MKQTLFSCAAAAAVTLVALGATATSIAGQGGTGTIAGHVHYMGPMPVNPIIRMGADPRCNKLYVGKRPTSPTFVVGADGAFANVLVNLDGSFPAAPASTMPVVLDQKDCQYVPRVVAARVGQTLQVRNDDPTEHNVHASSMAGNQAAPTILAASDNVYRSATDLTALHPATVLSVGGSQPHENRHPFLVLNWCIALSGIFPSPS